MIEAYMFHIGEIAERLSMDAETWMTAQEPTIMVLLMKSSKQRSAACIDPEIMAVYKNVPSARAWRAQRSRPVAERQAIIETQNRKTN